MAEAGIMKQVQLALSREPHVRCFRQNAGKALGVGMVRAAIAQTSGRSDLVNRLVTMQPLLLMPEGAADLSGLVGPEGFRFECEVKGPQGELMAQQTKWGAMTQSLGGIWFVARSPEDAVAELRAELRRKRDHLKSKGR